MTLGARRFRPIFHPLNAVRGLQYARKHGVRAAVRRVAWRLNPSPSFSTWIARYDTLRNRDRTTIEARLASLQLKPRFGLFIRLRQTEAPFLQEAVDSVVAQLYPHWELRIALEAHVGAETRTLLDRLAAADSRIAVMADAQMDAAALFPDPTDFFALIGSSDVLPPHALYRVAVEINQHPHCDIIYSDEDRIDADGRRRDPSFKLDWSPALFQSQNYLGHLVIYRNALVQEVGGPREEFGAAQDYDLSLRILSRTMPDRIRHIPHILYHSRSLPPVPSVGEAAAQALRAHFAAMEDAAEVIPTALPGIWRVTRPLPRPAPLVSLIVPTRDRLELLRSCIEGLLHRTRYPNIEIIVVDNESREPETLAYLDELGAKNPVSILRVPGNFNFSALNNRAAALAGGELIGLINNDIEVIDPGWLEEMVGQALQPDVGAVGAKLYYSDDTIQHAGVVLGIGGIAGHSHRFFPREAAGYLGSLHTVHDVSCVTAACMLVWKKVFDQVGGLDEVNLPVAFNDVDLCIKIRRAGYRLVWTPHAELYHRESASRGSDLAPQNAARFAREKAYIMKAWESELAIDPFYNPNLSLDAEDFRLASPPRIGRPWDT